jgi:DNA-directed RNA polymerase subunit RPC12/RpoP
VLLATAAPTLLTGEDVLHDYLVRVAENPASAVPLLGSLYRSALQEEDRFAALVELAVMDHPVWPWLSSISGIGAILAARLLSRLDVTRTRTPSSFWKYCGLATVPGTLYECAHCGTLVSGAPGLRHTPFHRSVDGARCEGGAAIGTAHSVNIAEPRPRAGASRSYDATARMACHLIGVSFARRGLGYKALYKERVASLAERHPEWPPKRIYLAAQRATVKRFLADLWGEWRRVAGLPVMKAYSLHSRRESADRAAPAERLAAGGGRS